MPMDRDCCDYGCIERGASTCAQDWPQAVVAARTHTITVAVDLRPALAVAAARTALATAQAEWEQAHLTDLESEDARQKVLDAEAALAAAEAALPPAHSV